MSYEYDHNPDIKTRVIRAALEGLWSKLEDACRVAQAKGNNLAIHEEVIYQQNGAHGCLHTVGVKALELAPNQYAPAGYVLIDLQSEEARALLTRR